ncbi:putative bifunctional diguanylate cyclase/phosphodiesterase [Noviherbaspirillum pedocola]|uniref:EAL domain-containing protein n=1 Tax=Noviherbaspirillum pedocola TaxID=2801341 RepID=A0A934W638_9BURK|nr:GGDEF domain-containing phosphodiesterase [Noviherbaspirillum pedocola]MBK4735732.1 EAL domain-containing protein [Noviherbaspirillum pedocola]
MKAKLGRIGAIGTGLDIFRAASLFLYVSLLFQIAVVVLIGGHPPGRPVWIALCVLAPLTVSALMRYLRPKLLLMSPRHILLELLATCGALGLLSLQSEVPLQDLPWWIALAGVFPLVLEARLSMVSVLVLASVGSLASATNPVQPELWLPGFFVTVFVGLLSVWLSNALATNVAHLEQALLNERRFNVIARAARHVFLITSKRFEVQFANPVIADVLGYTPREMEQGRMPEIHPEDLAERNRKLRLLRRGRINSARMMLRVRHKDGHWVWMEVRGYNMLQDPAINGMVFSMEDVSARIEAEHKLQQEHELLRAVLDLNPAMIYAKDRDGRFTISNASFQKGVGNLSDAQLKGRTVKDVFEAQKRKGRDLGPLEMAQRFHNQDMQVIRTGVPIENLEVRDAADGAAERWYRTFKYPLRDATGATSGMLGITRDVTESKEYEMRLEHLALHDPLTGLPNRRYLLKLIADHIAAGEPDEKLTVLYCDLDSFKNVNDIHGHDVGDRCLLEITRRVAELFPPPDVVSRFGSDEFAILVYAPLEEARRRADDLLQRIEQPIVVEDIEVRIHASIGIAGLLPEQRSPSELIRDADAAMYQAKDRGRNRIEVFDAALQRSATRRAQMDVALRFALERHELALVYQPQVSLADGTLTGFELLMRWNSPQYGQISPDDFIPIAENSGMVVPIGMWALEQACMQLKAWHQAYPRETPLHLGVNVSMRQLMHASFLQEVAQILQRTGVDPACIELELTETSAMANPTQTIENLAMLKSLGLRLALDDFGTGYSSLAYLQRLPIDVLKIDRAFVRGLGRDRNDVEIVQLILTLARMLGLDTVAEGIESRQQMLALRNLGCRLGQGFYFSTALSAADAEALLRENSRYRVLLAEMA